MGLDFMLLEKERVEFADDVILEMYDEKFSANITHNLTEMAQRCEVDGYDLYMLLWHPRKQGMSKVSQLINPLTKCYEKLVEQNIYLKRFNAPNGWGMYEHFVAFVEKIIDACKEYPNAIIVTDV